VSQLGAFQSKVKLTSEQQRLIAHNPKIHARLEAGPGTGKSFTLVAYLDSLLDQPDPPRVRLLTFTRAATAELAEKLGESPTAQALRPSTIHSFAISVLLRNPGTGRFPEPLRIADSWEDDRIVLETLKDVSGFSKTRLKGDLRPKMEANWESLELDPDFVVLGSDKARFLGAWEEHRGILGYTLLGELPYRPYCQVNEFIDLEVGMSGVFRP
jgi:DNA helicase-2/ATP-dependent DNA helicase PcrA